MVEFTLDSEKRLDGAVADWLLTVRRPSTDDLSKVYAKSVELAEAGYPISKSLIERAYRVLLSEKSVALVTEKMAPPESVKAETLSAEDWKKIPAAEAAKRYMRGGQFRQNVDALIKAGKI